MLKLVHPDLSISNKAIIIVDDMMKDIFDRLSQTAKKVVAKGGKKTITSRDVTTSIRLVLGPELAKHGVLLPFFSFTNNSFNHCFINILDFLNWFAILDYVVKTIPDINLSIVDAFLLNASSAITVLLCPAVPVGAD